MEFDYKMNCLTHLINSTQFRVVSSRKPCTSVSWWLVRGWILCATSTWAHYTIIYCFENRKLFYGQNLFFFFLSSFQNIVCEVNIFVEEKQSIASTIECIKNWECMRKKKIIYENRRKKTRKFHVKWILSWLAGSTIINYLHWKWAFSDTLNSEFQLIHVNCIKTQQKISFISCGIAWRICFRDVVALKSFCFLAF